MSRPKLFTKPDKNHFTRCWCNGREKIDDFFSSIAPTSGKVIFIQKQQWSIDESIRSTTYKCQQIPIETIFVGEVEAMRRALV